MPGACGPGRGADAASGGGGAGGAGGEGGAARAATGLAPGLQSGQPGHYQGRNGADDPLDPSPASAIERQ